MQVTIVLEKAENQFVARCLEVDVVSQGKTMGQAIDRAREAVGLYLDKSKAKLKDIYVATVEVP